MCGSPPGTRCASDTRDAAGRCLAEYIREWQGAGLGVDPASAIEAVMAHVRAGQVAQTSKLDPVLVAAAAERFGPRFGGTVRGQNPYVASEADLAGRLGGGASVAPAAVSSTQDAGTESLAPRSLESFGPVDPQSGPFPAAAGTWNVPNASVRTVQVGDQAFHKRVEGTFPGWPDGVRVEVGREISNEEMRGLAGIVRYSGRSELRNVEGLDGPYRDGPNSFVMYLDGTKTYSDDVGIAHERFEEKLPGMLREGTPVRKTDQGGVGTKGTRKWEGVPDIGEVSLWYDDVARD